MATPTIRESVSAAASAAAATVVTGAGTAVDDVLVCFGGNDWYTAAGMGAPTGTAGTWTLEATGDNGSNTAHIKAFTRAVTVGGAQTVTVSPIPDEEVYNSTIVLTGADTSAPADGAAGGNGAASTSHVAPSVSPATSDALLLCGAQSVGGGSGSAYTPPSGMTERTDVKDGTFAAQSVASLVLAASGATGTKTFTFSQSQAYATASVAVQGASATASGSSGMPRPMVASVHQSSTP
jgi:hypothetical protein